jgi:hypothetical protein
MNNFVGFGGTYENNSQATSWTLLFHNDVCISDWFMPAVEIGFNFNKFNVGKGDKFLFLGPEIIRLFNGQIQAGCYTQGYTVRIKQKSINLNTESDSEYADSPVLGPIYPWIGSILQIDNFQILFRTYFSYNDYTLMLGFPF